MVVLGFKTTQANFCTINQYEFLHVPTFTRKYAKRSMVTVYFGESQCGKHFDSAYTVNWQTASLEMLVFKAIKVHKKLCYIKTKIILQ